MIVMSFVNQPDWDDDDDNGDNYDDDEDEDEFWLVDNFDLWYDSEDPDWLSC